MEERAMVESQMVESQMVESPMVELIRQPPPADAIALMAAIEGVTITPTVLATQEGPDRHLGPEAAGAILLLQATFVDEEHAAGFWRTAAPLMEHLATAPGFIRRFNFTAGPHYTLIALWRSKADADAFFLSEPHQAAIRELYRNRWQYTHFAGLWEMNTRRERHIFCQHCEAVAPATAGVCPGCGAALADPFATR
jgi:heme-degrading monooxygenase HmoA